MGSNQGAAMPQSKAVKVLVSGQVQGVFFRAWTKGRAEELGVMGWIRNRLDGEVEGLLVGPEAAVDQLLELIWEGPSGAVVREVRIEDAKGITPIGFDIKPTV